MATEAEILRLQHKALELRLQVVKMMGANKIHHFGGSLSAADLITALYFYELHYDPQNPGLPQRDRFVMSKGHSVPAQYAALAMTGFFPLQELSTLKVLGSRLQGHPAMHLTPGLEACTGALGEGLSYANGIALASRISGIPFRVYCLIGDGELQEGQVWEAAMTASKHRLSNLVAMIDRNKLKAMDTAESSKLLDPLGDRWLTFGWAVREIDGHNMTEICDALDWSKSVKSKPVLILCNTIKGKGISFLEGQASFHNSAVSNEQYQQAIHELEAQMEMLEVQL
jgi:transketolase